MISDLNSREFALMQKFIEEKCGITISEDKAYLIESRLSSLMINLGLDSFESLYAKICSNTEKDIVEKVIDAITTNETLWFRDKHPWVVLEDILLPLFIRQIREGKRKQVRIWSAACSTGQEPYSTAMCIDHYLKKNSIADVKLSDFEILATDISRTVLQIAQMGKFDSISIVRGLDPSYKEKYFKNEDRVWSLAPGIMNAVRFQPFNLQDSFSILGTFDIIFCRYVIIYFARELKRQVIHKVKNSLEPGGILFIGSSELFFGFDDLFESEEYKKGVYYRAKG